MIIYPEEIKWNHTQRLLMAMKCQAKKFPNHFEKRHGREPSPWNFKERRKSGTTDRRQGVADRRRK